MKNHYILLVSFITLSIVQPFAQDTKNYDPVKAELSHWDPVRGLWLAASLEAMANNKPIPSRPFPESFTPHQMLRMVPADTRGNISQHTKQARANDGNATFWTSIDRYVNSPNCTSTIGRSYGDPHLVSFDGARYSFQTVGEFVLAKSNNNDLEVQTRQKPQRQDFSLNTAVAMNVAGDRVCIYASDFPDSDYSTPVRLNGKPVQLNGSTYFLPHGGTLKKLNNNFVVHWPSGESVTTELRGSDGMEFLNVSVNILSCSNGDFIGLMGNANGMSGDDFNSGTIAPPIAMRNDPFGNENYGNAERQAFITRQFAENFRITNMTSLFDYQIGKNTETYTDRSFPRVIHDFNDLDQRRIDRSRKYCENSGIAQNDMNGCIYDHAYLDLEASQAPIVHDPTEGTVLRPASGNVINENPRPRPVPVVRPTPVRPAPVKPSREVERSTPESSTPERSTPERSEPEVREEPIRTIPESRPSEPEPRPIYTPAPTPTPRPAPTPTPSAPKSSGVTPRGGR